MDSVLPLGWSCPTALCLLLLEILGHSWPLKTAQKVRRAALELVCPIFEGTSTAEHVVHGNSLLLESGLQHNSEHQQ
jgi:hypothetical protein